MIRIFQHMVILATIFTTFIITSVSAQETNSQSDFINQTLEGVVVKVVEEKAIMPQGGTEKQLYQKLEIDITEGFIKGKRVAVESGDVPSAQIQRYKLGDRVVLNRTIDPQGGETIYIVDYVRREALLWLFILFAVAAIAVGRWWGFTSLIGMGISFLVIFKFILPQISAGSNPLLIAILGSLVIVPFTFYLSHGFNKKTTIAIAGTICTLVITGVLALTFTELANLTGFASEEATFLQSFHPGLINMKGLLLAGIIIGGLGVFDDVTVSQAAIVEELKNTASHLDIRQLYFRAMKIGRDHIASVVNTLVLVYAGAALPLLLLFVDNPRPFAEIINYEFVADEIVRTLVASIGLILAVPITTVLAAYVFGKKK